MDTFFDQLPDGSWVQGGTITYTVSLAAPVAGSPVTVNLANGEVVTIGVGDSSGTATAIAPDNAYSGSGSVTNSIASVNNYIDSLRDFWIAQADLEMALIGKPSLAIPAGPTTAAAAGGPGH
mgnify:CR=1 FL=1